MVRDEGEQGQVWCIRKFVSRVAPLDRDYAYRTSGVYLEPVFTPASDGVSRGYLFISHKFNPERICELVCTNYNLSLSP